MGYEMIQALKHMVCVIIITAESVNVKFTVENSSCSNMHIILEEKACFNSVY